MLIHEVPTPYEAVIGPILNTLIKNPLKEEVSLPDGRVLAPNEMMSWIELIKLKNKK